MRWIGHYEFGANLRPIDFDGRYRRDGVPREADATFWLEYWTAAYGHALGSKSRQVRWVDFDGLRREPAGALARLADLAGLRDASRLVTAAGSLRAPTTEALAPDAVPAATLEAAREVYRRLQAAAV